MMTLRIGSGSAWWGDRISPAQRNAAEGDLDYLCFETMAESTVSAAQIRARRDPAFGGYDTYLEERFHAVLPHCIRRGTRIISNQGWIDPVAAAKTIRRLLDEHGASDWPVAAVTGNVITDSVKELGDRIFETGAPLEDLPGEIVSAEAYLGAEPIVSALRQGARVVVTGRLADPALFLAPMMHEFGWAADDAHLLGQGAGIGHLMECGAQITGGYYPDPGYKDVPEPWDLAFPIAEVEPDGATVITKLPGGGVVNRETVLEQMFYEVHDPAYYITPDVVVDFTTADVEEIGADRVRVANIGGVERTPTLKVSIGVTEGWMGEDMFFYAGPGALGRARLAETILRERFAIVGLQAEDLRIDFLGMNAIHGPASVPPAEEPYEIAVRVAARTSTRAEAEKVGREVDGMAVSGISATGKRVPFGERVREVIGIWSTLVPRDDIVPRVELF
jgi:hypothetical protein